MDDHTLNHVAATITASLLFKRTWGDAAGSVKLFSQVRAELQKLPDGTISAETSHGSDEKGMPLDPNHPWNREAQR